MEVKIAGAPEDCQEQGQGSRHHAEDRDDEEGWFRRQALYKKVDKRTGGKDKGENTGRCVRSKSSLHYRLYTTGHEAATKHTCG